MMITFALLLLDLAQTWVYALLKSAYKQKHSHKLNYSVAK